LLVSIQGIEGGFLINLLDNSSNYTHINDSHLSWGPDSVLLSYNLATSVSRSELFVLYPPSLKDRKLLGQTTGAIVDAHLVNDKSALFLRHIGWVTGPNVVQLFAATEGIPVPQPRSQPQILLSPRLSPTGRYAAGWQDGSKLKQLVIMDLQTGRKVRIQGASHVEMFQWVA